MSIEPSVIIWTVINFIILMLVLRFMLFKPMLKVMHDRRDKIEKSSQAVRLAKEKSDEQKRLLSSRLEEETSRLKIQAARNIEEAAETERQAVRLHEDNEDERIEEYRIQLKKEEKLLEDEFNARLPEFAKAFADMIISKEL